VDKQAGMTDEIRSLACFVASIRIERQRRCIIMDMIESTKKAEWMEDRIRMGLPSVKKMRSIFWVSGRTRVIGEWWTRVDSDPEGSVQGQQ
jgi:hypothetical protein